jgi:3-deoxy-D-manno-octulosonic-acid transferase
MIFFYRFLTIIILILSPIIILLRFIKKKEHPKRFKEKFCFFTKKRNKGKLVWFHGASVGELQSIIPLLKKISLNKKVSQILITSNTLSSSKIIDNLKIKKVTHQFFPLDLNFFCKKFINYWNPSISIFIDSEIWPNMIENLESKKIPIILLNARITKKTLERWLIFSNFAKRVFGKLNLSLTSNLETIKYLKMLGVKKKIKYYGNLKFTQLEQKINSLNKNFKNFIKSKKIWCASSTHFNEEKVCGLIHKKLKKKYKNLVTIIIPRHIDRVNKIKKELNKLDLKVHIDKPLSKIDKKTDVYLVNTYGETKKFFSFCKNIFLGGSLINHGGQNPLEAARFGCKILHGKNIFNFKEIYKFLRQNKISHLVKTTFDFQKKLEILLDKENNSSGFIKKKINKIGDKILINTYKEINFYLKNAI